MFSLKKMGRKRGFVITMLTVGLVLLVVTLAISFRDAQLSTDRALIEPLPLLYSAFLLDGVAGEFNSLVGPGIGIHESNDSIYLSVTDTLHGANHSSEISSYGQFLSGQVASSTQSNITTNFSSMDSGVVRVFIDEDYLYSNDHANNESVFTRVGGTGAKAYYVNFTVTAVRANVTTDFEEGGTVNVTVRYTDLNGTGVEEGRLFPGHANSLEVEYVGGSSIVVEIGPESGNSGSLRIKTEGIGAAVSWAAVLPPINETKKLGYAYESTVKYVQGKVSKGGRIGK